MNEIADTMSAEQNKDKCNFNLSIKKWFSQNDPGKVKIEFSVVPDRGECQLSTRCFLQDQKILFLAEVIGF